MKDIIIDFNGWVRISPKKVTFVCIGDDKPEINGEEWQRLSEDDRSDYILEDVIAAQRDCDDGSYDEIDVFTDPSTN